MNCPYPLVAAGADSLQRPEAPFPCRQGTCSGLADNRGIQIQDRPKTLTISVVLRQVSELERLYNEDADRELLGHNGRWVIIQIGNVLLTCRSFLRGREQRIFNPASANY